jgi:HAE1 family hydrophobic/amphiphilic exporter-1
MDKKSALLETGRVRIRPILMTAITTVLGLSTLSVGMGMGAEMLQPLAITAIGGLTYATLLTLFVVPVMYDIFHRKDKRKIGEDGE